MKKATHKTDRQSIRDFRQIVNIGEAFVRDFEKLGFSKPQDLVGQDPWRLYVRISEIDGQVHDPCVLDCFIATIDYLEGNPPRKWWDYTAHRKKLFSDKIASFKAQFVSQ